MAKKNEDRISMKEAFALTARAVKLLNQYAPGCMLAMNVDKAMEAVLPYAAVFFSARILDELTFGRREDVLWMWILAAVITAGVLAACKAFTKYWADRKDQQFSFRHWRVYTDKQLSLDFLDVESQEVQDQLAQIQQRIGWSWLGLPRVSTVIKDSVSAITGIISAVALTAGLLLTHVPAENTAYRWLDGPLAYLALAAALALIVAANAWMTRKNGELQRNPAMAEEATQGNRIWGYYTWQMGNQPERSLDFRVYNQQSFLGKLTVISPWTPGGLFDKLWKGPVGVMLGLSEASSALLSGAVYVYVCLKAWVGAFGVGSVTQYVSAVTALTGSVSALFKQFAEIRVLAPYLKDTYAYLDRPNPMYQGSLTTEKRSDRNYQVEFRNVSFKYPGSDRWALKNVTMQFNVGSRIAVVGENGSGKSTFIKLLCRLYDPQEGEILLNGINIRKYSYPDYIGIFSVVFQDFQLFSQPLGANVAGREDYDRERVLKCLQDAGFDERLESMPQGLDTQLYRDFSSDGVMVSGGEAQKIAIARALYKDAPFIVLDEPTAALDPMAEAEIYAKFNGIVGDKTAVYISHRLSSCRFCDTILVFDDGRIVQQGTHDGLLQIEDGKYATLWHAQAQYYDEESRAALDL